MELIINEYDEKLVKKKFMLSKEDISELFGIPILGTIPHDPKVFVSQNRGIPVITMRSKAPAVARAVAAAAVVAKASAAAGSSS